jgi:CheY-like chemotaxis protein
MKVIVLIDDDIDDQEIFELALEQTQKPTKFIGFSNGKEAIREMSKPSFHSDLIFIDVNMPGMGGLECMKELKKLPHLRAIPMYFYTTSDNRSERNKLLTSGATEVITKPTGIKDLVDLLSNLLHKQAIKSIEINLFRVVIIIIKMKVQYGFLHFRITRPVPISLLS